MLTDKIHTQSQERVTSNIMAVGLLLFFFTLYSSFSLLLSKTGAFETYSVLFEIDTPRIIDDMTSIGANHYRTNVHPLFVLLMNPIGSILSQVVKSQVLAAILLNCFFGALDVTLAFFYFKSLDQTLKDACLLAFLFGVTASQFFLSSIPETASLAICSLITTYMLFLFAVKSKKDYFLAWVAAGLFTLAVTTTNFIQTLICFSVYYAIWSPRKNQRFYAIGRILSFLTSVIAVAVLLSTLQKAIYPSSSLFYLPQSYLEDTLYTSGMIFQRPLAVISQLLKHFVLVNIIAPFPTVFSFDHVNPALTYNHGLDYTLLGWLALVLWLCSLAAGILLALIKKQEIPMVLGFAFALCLLFNFAFHSIYGRGVSGDFEYFLYTGNFTFLVFSSIAHLPYSTIKSTRGLLLMLILLTGINNIMMIERIMDIYK
ncbi:MAG: hypothetical protein HZB19_16800 [Chloroflexi bacterium]|nr:hypothetical protein [Chloroflexota bacterium]